MAATVDGTKDSTKATPGWLSKLTPGPGGAEMGLALAVVFVIALLIVPLPSFMLDLLLVLSIASSIVVLLSALYAKDPLEFSTFPSVLLILTLFRLSLNVATTRLILGHGDAGKVIHAFGAFVIGGNFAVGIVIFLILIVINFIVITKGAGRVAEVAARFTLDAMPGKQMAIDADLSAGLIDEREARRRREEISQQADFYGAMDGSSKFVKGDAIAGLIITFVNIIGGMFIGMIQKGMGASEAASKYTILTVGDGLVTQIPALVISVAAGLMVTHSAGSKQMGGVMAGQLSAQPRAMWISAGVLATFALVPGLPTFPFLALGAGMGALARMAGKAERVAAQADQVGPVRGQPALAAPSDPMQDLLGVDPIALDVGFGLISVVDDSQGGSLLEKIALLRKQAAVELGILVPAVRIRDDLKLMQNEYVVKLRGVEVARADVMPRHLLALNTGSAYGHLDGIEGTDPSFGLPATWILPAAKGDAEAMGYVVVDPSTVMATHLMEVLKTHAADLLGRQDVQEMVDTLKKTHPALLDDIIPGKLSLGILHRVLQRLLRERVPIRDLVTILEALGDAAETTKDAEILTEYVRRSMANVVARLYLADDGSGVKGLTVGPRLEAALTGLFSPKMAERTSDPAVKALFDPEKLADSLKKLAIMAETFTSEGKTSPLICAPNLRVGIRKLIEPVLPNLPVVSLAELPSSIAITSIGVWDL